MTRENTASTATTSRSRCSSSISADRILSEMSRSFALCKSTGLYQFYDQFSTKKGDTDSSSYSWMPSLDFLSSISISTSNSTSGTTVATPGASNDVFYGKMGSLSSPALVADMRGMSSLVHRLEDRFTNFLNQNLQVNGVGMVFGAVAGAAVATGVILGIMAVTGAMAAAASTTYRLDSATYTPPFLRQILQTWTGGIPESTTNNTGCSVSTGGPLVLLQGSPSSSAITAEEQCLSCLDNVQINLRQQHGMEWKHVRRLTVYLVTGKCQATTFRNALGRFNQNIKAGATEAPLVTILFVQRLEDEFAMVQLEAMASKY